MIEARLEGVDRIDAIGRKLHVATAKKLTALTDMLYNKVQENLSGKILNKQSGELSRSIRQEVDTASYPMVGSVFPDPATPKAIALEKGGERYYDIVPTKAQMLRFFSKSGDLVFTKHVLHPPSKEFAYLREALAEIEPLIPEGFAEAIYTEMMT